MKKKIFKNIPNILTFSRIILSLIGFILFILKFYKTCIIVLLIAAITDLLDGKIARKFNLRFGL